MTARQPADPRLDAGQARTGEARARRRTQARVLLAIPLLALAAAPLPAQDVSETALRVRALQERNNERPLEPLPDWALGPFHPLSVDGRAAEFRPRPDWSDPAGVPGWSPRAFWNPSLIEAEGRLYLFYRTGPTLEGLNSRIALAWSDDGGVSWTDYERNPILYPTEPWESQGVEDPRVYRLGGTYYLFYMAVQERENGDGVYVDIAYATSPDLVTWTKRGRVVPRDVSGGWAKSAVIPRSATGDAVAIDGEYLMYISERPAAGERDVDEQMIGRSRDLSRWTFEPRPFLDPRGPIHSIYEFATMTAGVPGPDAMVADVFYRTHAGDWACGQVLYRMAEPTEPVDFVEYGVCSWGGKILHDGRWLYAQGWLEPGAIQLYVAPHRPTGR